MSLTEIVAALPVREYLREAGTKFTNTRETRGICPACQHHRPSLALLPGGEQAQCFHCGTRGDVVNWTCTLEGLTTREAVRRLGARLGIQGRDDQAKWRDRPPEDASPLSLGVGEVERRKRGLRRLYERWAALDKLFQDLDDRALADGTISQSLADERMDDRDRAWAQLLALISEEERALKQELDDMHSRWKRHRTREGFSARSRK